MNRPTREELELAMRHRWGGDAADRAVPVLQAEVRALQAELEAAREAHRRDIRTVREQATSLVDPNTDPFGGF